MKSELQRSALSIEKSGVHGYGVFAQQDFSPGDLIEECYSLTVRRNSEDLTNFVFGGVDDSSVMPLGFGAIYNHSDTPNIDWEHFPHQSLIVFRAIKPIKNGDELFHDYGKNWFERREITARNPSMRSKLSMFLRPIDILARFTLIVAVILLGVKIFSA